MREISSPATSQPRNADIPPMTFQRVLPWTGRPCAHFRRVAAAKLWTLHPHLHAKLADDILDLLLGES